MYLFNLNNPYWQGVNKLLLVVWLGFLWFLCSLPIVTAGASTTALYYVMFKVIKEEESYVTRQFFYSFHMNFKQAVVVELILLVIGFILGYNVWFYWIYGGGTKLLLSIFLFFSVFYSIVAMFLPPVLAKFDNSIRQTFFIAIVFAVKNILWAVLALLVAVVLLLISVAFYGFPLFFIMGPITYFQAFIFRHVFDSYFARNKITQNN